MRPGPACNVLAPFQDDLDVASLFFPVPSGNCLGYPSSWSPVRPSFRAGYVSATRVANGRCVPSRRDTEAPYCSSFTRPSEQARCIAALTPSTSKGRCLTAKVSPPLLGFHVSSSSRHQERMSIMLRPLKRSSETRSSSRVLRSHSAIITGKRGGKGLGGSTELFCNSVERTFPKPWAKSLIHLCSRVSLGSARIVV